MKNLIQKPITTMVCQSPGSINLIGEHTDYNEGFVLPAAINKKTTFTIHKNGSEDHCRVQALNLSESFEFDLHTLEVLDEGWQNYIVGVVRELIKLGAKIEGFDGSFEGDIPIGSGMSSSAALACSFAFVLNELFELNFSKTQLIKVAQMAENQSGGTKCSIMKQFASVMGRKDQVILLDCRTLEYKYFPLELGKYEILLLNTNISHSLSESAYNERRNQCEEGIRFIQDLYPEIQNLRDVNFKILDRFSKILPPIIYKRCHHVVSENHRVLEATEALKMGNVTLLGQLMNASHASLRDDYEVSCPELDFLVEKSKRHAEILGSRMMGAGFGGCTINIIRKGFTETFIEKISTDYKAKFNKELTPYRVSIEDGTLILK